MSFDWMEFNDPGSSSQAINQATSGGNSANSDFLSLNEPAGNTGDNYIQNNPYISPGYRGLDVQSTVSDPSIIGKLSGYAQNLYQDANGNIDFGKVATLLGGLYGASTYNKGLQGGEGAGYQGGIPQLYAGRNMITAPPTMIDGKARRPGQGGINYGGDVTYFNTQAEVAAQKAAVDAANAAAAAKAEASAPLAVAAGANNTCGPGYTYNAALNMCIKNTALTTGAGSTVTSTSTVVGGTGNDKISTIVGGGGNDTLVGGGGTDSTVTAAAAAAKAAADAAAKAAADKAAADAALAAAANADAATKAAAAAAAAKAAADKAAADAAAKAAADASAKAVTDSFLSSAFTLHQTQPHASANDINQWILDHPNASIAEINAARQAGNTTNRDIADALSLSTFSPAVQGIIKSGQGLDVLNKNINDWVAKHPYATKDEIAEIEKASGVSAQDVANALTQDTMSAGKEYALVHNMGLDTFYNNILKYMADQAADKTTPAYMKEMSARAAMQEAGVTDKDIQDAQKFAQRQKDIEAFNAQNETVTKKAGGGEIMAAKGRYLQGETDGMADEIPAQIGDNQPAALSHGEFVVPADVVSHLGNGNSDAGAKKLYQMMDKIRMARTGTKKQGKKINPDKFMPGGLAAAYASGGKVKHFLAGGSTTASLANAGVTGIESNLSNWAGPYVTNMLGQGQALANMPYQAYTGPLTAGESPLQTQAFTAAGKLSTPTAMTNSATNLDTIAKTASGLSYKPDTYTNQFTAPIGIPEATNFTNQYAAPTAYTPATSAFNETQLQSYMNPYLNKILEPQLEEARRQSKITQAQNAAKMTAAGAYGGGRQAILDAETQRALAATQAGITGQGYNTAYTNALQQFNADQNRKMQEAQFAATQGMNAAQLQAQYGLSAQQANEMARQFGAQQKMTAAQSAAQYGQAANQANEAAKEFAANYGLQGLQTGLQAAQAQGNLGAQTGQLGLQQLAQQLAAGQTQRDIESQGIAADLAQFEEARNNPFKMIQFQQSLLSGLPTSAQAYNLTGSNALTAAAQGATTIAQLIDAINGKKTTTGG